MRVQARYSILFEVVTIYVKQIPGLPEENPRTVLKLLVALYGLKQSAYKWYKLLSVEHS
jgi:hypothetical protein